ncbi:unnamed protein product, partial [Oppiella nova]
ISARPLPPLPSPPHTLSPSHTFASNESLNDYEWYHSVEREDAEALLLTQEEDGAYLVRESKRAGKCNPYTLTIFHNGRVFHLNIRKRPDDIQNSCRFGFIPYIRTHTTYNTGHSGRKDTPYFDAFLFILIVTKEMMTDRLFLSY